VVLMMVVAVLWRWRGHSVSVERVAIRLADPDRAVRLRTAQALGQLRAPGMVHAMVARLQVEADAEVRDALCLALGRTRSHEAARALADVLAGSDAALTGRARRALEAMYRRPLPADVAAVRALVASEPPP
jgi:HEAT repeat protein